MLMYGWIFLLFSSEKFRIHDVARLKWSWYLYQKIKANKIKRKTQAFDILPSAMSVNEITPNFPISQKDNKDRPSRLQILPDQSQNIYTK